MARDWRLLEAPEDPPGEVVFTDDEGWMATFRYTAAAPLVGPTEVHVRLTDVSGRTGDVEELSVVALRALPLQEANAEQARRQLAMRTVPAEPRDDGFFALVARDYADVCATGVQKPVAMLAEAYGVGESALRQWITRARDRGFLSPTEGGKPGGTLTAPGQTVLTMSGRGAASIGARRRGKR